MGKTFAEHVMDLFDLSPDIRKELSDFITKTSHSIMEAAAKGQFWRYHVDGMICVIEQKLTSQLTDEQRDTLTEQIVDIALNQLFSDTPDAYFYVYVVENSKYKQIRYHINKKVIHNNVENARKHRDAASPYYDTIFKVKINGNGFVSPNWVCSVEMLNPEVETIISYINDCIKEHRGYAISPDYDEWEQHDARVAIEAYRDILTYIDKLLPNPPSPASPVAQI